MDMDELKQLKQVLRSLVVSSPVQMTLANLMRDYRSMMGCHLPIQKYGYRDPLQFLKDRCGDCFLFQGYGTNTVLVPIVPECLKHIDEFVHKQRVSSKIKFKGKRRSINESVIRPASDLIAKTFDGHCTSRIKTEPPNPVRERQSPSPQRNVPLPPNPVRERQSPSPQRNVPLPPKCDTRQPENIVPPTPNVNKTTLPANVEYTTPKLVDTNLNKYKSMSNLSEQNKENRHHDSGPPSKEAYKNFLRNRLPIYESTQDISNDNKSYKDSESGSFTSGSGQRTLSSSSSTKAIQLEDLKAELLQLIKGSPNGVRTTDLMKLYRERYGRELNFSRFGFSSVSALACGLPGAFTSHDADGATRVSLAPPASPAPPLPAGPRRVASQRPRVRGPTSVVTDRTDEEDALPWIDFDPDVFPSDCMSFSESIPPASLEGVCAGGMLEVMVGEVYSPSHFWLYRLGDQYNIAMEDMMDEMTNYYTSGEGTQRALAVGAVRVGHYCSSVFERDWHRSLIVKIVDSDTVKVRHVDYGTVDRVAVSRLKPLLRRWSALPAQAVRARLAGVCPAARGRRWPHAAAAAFLRLVQDRRLVANVAHVDHEENIVELFLVDTSTERDVRIDLELVRTGHADPRADTTLAALAASYLYPRFDALESGDTPNFADIHAYLRDGIALEYVEDYSRHVPPALPHACAPAAAAPLAPHPHPPPRKALDNRVPLIPRSLQDVTAVVSPVARDRHCSRELLRESPVESDPDPDSSLDEEPAASPPVDSAFVEEGEAEAADRTYSCGEAEARAPTPAPAPAPAAPLEEAREPAEASPERTKPECRAAPRLVPDPRPLPRADPRPRLSMSHPLLPTPPMPALPFFVFPRPGPPLPPYPSYPLHPAFPPRPYPPAMEGFYSPPHRHYQPPMRAHFTGPVYSSGPMYSSKPTYSYPSAPVSNVNIAHAPISYGPVPAAPVPAIPVSKPPVSAAVPARSAPAPVVTASVAPTPAPAAAGAGPAPPGARRTGSQSPPPPYNGGPRRIATGHGEVTLSVSECEIFNLLSSVDPNAAHWYMVDAISRAMVRVCTTDAARAPRPSAGEAASSRLNPEASEFRAPHAPAPALRPPPGFNAD